MKKLLFGALTLTMILALTGWATDTRVLTLGEDYSIYFNSILKDESNINFYPSTLTMYRGMVLGEVADSGSYGLSSPNLYRVGGHYDFGEGNGVVGLYLDKRGLGIDPSFMPNPLTPSGFGDGIIDNRLNLYYARPFGEMPFGLAFSLYRDSYKVNDDTANVTEQSNTAFGVQLGISMMEKLDLGAGLMYQTWTHQDANGHTETDPETNLALNLMMRYWYAFNDQVDFVPHLSFMYSTAGFTNFTGLYPFGPGTDPDSTKFQFTNLLFDVGWGVNIRPEEHVLLLFDLGITYQSQGWKDEPTVSGATDYTPDETHTYLNLPYFRVGLEGHVTRWWDVRLAALKRWRGTTEEYTVYTDPTDLTKSYVGNDKYGTGETATYLGSGIHFGNFYLDVMLDPEFVLKGPNFVSGYDGSLAAMASIKYAWK